MNSKQSDSGDNRRIADEEYSLCFSMALMCNSRPVSSGLLLKDLPQTTLVIPYWVSILLFSPTKQKSKRKTYFSKMTLFSGEKWPCNVKKQKQM